MKIQDSSWSDKRSIPDHLGFLLLAIGGFLLVIASTDKFGPGVSSDSVGYISAAHSLVQGRGFLDYDGSPFTLMPPLFPMVLGAGIAFGMDPLRFARVFDAMAFGLIIFCIGQIALRIVGSRMLRFMLAATAMLSTPLLAPAIMVWSETIFILLVLIFILILSESRSTHLLKPSVVAVLTIVAACACLQRYLGVTCVFCGVVCLMTSHHTRFRKRFVASAIFFILSMLPLAVWSIRNYRLGSGAFGPRTESVNRLYTLVGDFVVIWTEWYLPGGTPNLLRAAAFVLSIGIVVVFVLVRPPSRGDTAARNAVFFVAGLFILVYSAALLAAERTVTLTMEPRYLSPILPVSLLFVFTAIEGFSWFTNRNARTVWGGSASLLRVVLPLLVLSESAIEATHAISHWRRDGAGSYTSADWQNSELIKWLSEHPLDGKVYCNGADFVHFKSGIVTAQLPRRAEDLLSWQQRMNPNEKHYAAWFSFSLTPGLYTSVDFLEQFTLVPVFVREREALFELK